LEGQWGKKGWTKECHTEPPPPPPGKEGGGGGGGAQAHLDATRSSVEVGVKDVGLGRHHECVHLQAVHIPSLAVGGQVPSLAAVPKAKVVEEGVGSYLSTRIVRSCRVVCRVSCVVCCELESEAVRRVWLYLGESTCPTCQKRRTLGRDSVDTRSTLTLHFHAQLESASASAFL